ncbi:MAG: glycosyltransferase [Planctomycetota bacterium]
MLLLQIVCTLSLAAAAAGCFYQVLLALVALLPRAAGPLPTDSPDTTFAIVIPAHNEETVIADTLRSCAAIDYPADKKTVYVVADNCDDRTAQIAQTAGATCLVRTDTQQRGKGQALRWAFDRILPEGPDAVVVLDADSALESGSLNAFDRHLRSGEAVLQANSGVANPDDNATSYVLAVASTLENDLFYAPKDRLGMAVLLQGTGMVLSRRVLLDKLSLRWMDHVVCVSHAQQRKVRRTGVPAGRTTVIHNAVIAETDTAARSASA